MQTATNLLPNHFPGIYKEMRGALEEQVFNIDFKAFVKSVYETSILEEFQSVIGVEEYDRGPVRQNQRNGYYYRSLDTVYGYISELKIPRPRHGGFTPQCLQKFKRREGWINKLICECFFRGISTRDLKYITKALAGVDVSSSTVSRLSDEWLSEVNRWHQRELGGHYVYLMFDGIWIKNRFMGLKRKLILVAYGIRSDGTREIIDYRFAQSESEANWLKFLTNLEYRGLKNNQMKLITTDGCVGLANAIDMVYPTVKHQLCWAHKMRNILKNVKKTAVKEVHKGLKPLFSGDWNRPKAMGLINGWRRKWQKEYPQAVRCLERDIEKLLHYLEMPLEHHQAIRTSNHIERQFKEYRRRMKPMEVTPTLNSADKMLYAQTMFRNEKLRSRPLTFTHNTLH